MRNVMFVLLAFCFCVAPALASPSPVLNYTFDAGSGAVVHDFSGNGNDGNISGSGAFWADGLGGTSGIGFNFDALSSVVIPDDASLDTYTKTVVVWVKTNVTSGVPWGVYSDTGAFGFGVGIHYGDGYISFADQTGFLDSDYSGQAYVSDDAWHQIAIVLDSDGLTYAFYVDGSQRGTGAWGGFSDVSSMVKALGGEGEAKDEGDITMSQVTGFYKEMWGELKPKQKAQGSSQEASSSSDGSHMD